MPTFAQKNIFGSAFGSAFGSLKKMQPALPGAVFLGCGKESWLAKRLNFCATPLTCNPLSGFWGFGVLGKVERSIMEARLNVRLEKNLLGRLDASLPLANAKSRNEYILKAIQFYNVYLQMEGDPDIFSKVVGDIVAAKITHAINKESVKRADDTERIARNQFKVATELAKLCIIISNSIEVPKEKLKEWHLEALNEVRKINGIMDFEER